MSELLLVADATNLTHRCWHASGRSEDPQVVARMVEKLIKGGVARVGANQVLAAFDGPDAGLVRYSIHPEYKAGRKEKGDSLKRALESLPRLLTSAGMRVHAETGIEADDILAHYAEDQQAPTTLLTSDKDALALLTNNQVSMLRVGSGGVDRWDLLNSTNLERLVGVAPADYGLYAALKGDSSDNIPGVAGIGDTYAKALARAHHTVAGFTADLRAGGPATLEVLGKARTAKLLNNLESVLEDLDVACRMVQPLPLAEPPARSSCAFEGTTAAPRTVHTRSLPTQLEGPGVPSSFSNYF